MDYMELPINVQIIVDGYGDEQQLTYEECRKLVEDLNKIGWTCDYDLAGIPFDFTKVEDEKQKMPNGLGRASVRIEWNEDGRLNVWHEDGKLLGTKVLDPEYDAKDWDKLWDFLRQKLNVK